MGRESTCWQVEPGAQLGGGVRILPTGNDAEEYVSYAAAGNPTAVQRVSMQLNELWTVNKSCC